MTSLVLAAPLFYPMEILLYIIFSFILIRQKNTRHGWRAVWAFPSLEILFYKVDKTFQILDRIWDPGPYMEQSLNGGARFLQYLSVLPIGSDHVIFLYLFDNHPQGYAAIRR